MEFKIALIRGDGIGPEVVNGAVTVIDKVAERFGHKITYVDVDMGGNATDKYGVSYPAGTAEKCKACDAVLLGAVGGPSGGRISLRSSALRLHCWLFARIWGCLQILRHATLRPALIDNAAL